MPRDDAPAIHPLDRDALADEAGLVARLVQEAALDAPARAAIAAAGADLVRRIRAAAKPGLMEVFLAEYGLSTDEGIALMCLAEALLRVPDAETMDALIEDKIAPADWGRHLGRSASTLVNASTWALMLTGRVLDDREPGVVGHLKAAVRRLGEPVIRRAVGQAMKEMGRQFVLGETIQAAMTRAEAEEARGYTYSYDMLGEAARTEADARRYHLAYADAITAIAGAARGNDIRTNPGISVKLSALHPRYEVAQEARVMAELVPRVRALAGLARAAGIGFNIDAEEADRLALSARVIEAVLVDPALAGWDGFGVVVQAYGRRAGAMIDWLHDLATRADRRIMVRLVKGAYWDAEVKRAQVMGLQSFPVFTRKQATDVSYIANARKLLGMAGRIYPQFATHNAHTVAAVLHIAAEMGVDAAAYEFQRLHGMGERLHDIVLTGHGTRCRIYAPVGAHRDLLAYLVRRLLENGANSSFVNQIVDDEVPPEAVAACPLTATEALALPNPAIPAGPDLFPGRRNAAGWDLTDGATLAALLPARDGQRDRTWEAAPILAGSPPTPSLPHEGGGMGWGGLPQAVTSPADGGVVGHVRWATPADVDAALAAARPWDASDRAAVLNRAADLMEADHAAIFALLAREAGKTLPDAVGEVREAVDFLRYYAAGIAGLAHPARGIVACISPWNFPLAIFCGQVAAALAAGNAVLAKPAEQTPLVAAHAVRLMHQAGVPATALQLLPGDGSVGAALTGDPRVAAVAFTGSTETARLIRASMAARLSPTAPLVAETGGLNAMVVDSTALPEQAVRDVLASAFQSAGQRCSALRCLYLQEDVADHVEAMLLAAMDELRLGDPWDLATDVGPVIDAAAQADIAGYIDGCSDRVIKRMAAPAPGHFIGPTVIRVTGIRDLPREVFGPVLHIARFRAGDLGRLIADINATGYGLTFGCHTRIDDRVQMLASGVHAGNIYVNRNQIGAVVGSQPFGGEGLSGTGPKAGGPHYLARFTAAPVPAAAGDGAVTTAAEVRASLARLPAPPAPETADMPGPTGESNRLTLSARAPFLALGPGRAAAAAQVAAFTALGGQAVAAPGLDPAALADLPIGGSVWWGDADGGRAYAQALAARPGPILPLVAMPDAGHARAERHVCIDTTASGGNAQLLAAAGG